MISSMIFCKKIYEKFDGVDKPEKIKMFIKDVIDKKVAKEINVEADYLKRRNEITYLGDMAVSEGYIPSYEELERIYKNSDDKKIKQAAKAEIVRVELLLSIPFDYYPINMLEYISNGKTSIGKNIETSILVDMIKQSKDIGKITSIIEVLFERKHEKNLPQVLLNIGKDTDHLQIRYTALFRVQALVEDFTANPYNYEEFSKWWLTSGKNKWGERK